MAQVLKLKRSATAAKVPSTSDLALGELAMNTNDGKVYFRTGAEVLSDIGGSSTTGDMTGVDAPRIQVSDTDGDGVSTPQADQVDALTHSGTASFDQESYKIADTVTVTITDMDLNTDSELIEVYKTHTDNKVGDTDGLNVGAGANFSHIMELSLIHI